MRERLDGVEVRVTKNEHGIRCDRCCMIFPCITAAGTGKTNDDLGSPDMPCFARYNRLADCVFQAGFGLSGDKEERPGCSDVNDDFDFPSQEIGVGRSAFDYEGGDEMSGLERHGVECGSWIGRDCD